MPKKPNYNFEKRQKELVRQKKKEEKRLERQQRRDEREPSKTEKDEAGAPELGG